MATFILNDETKRNSYGFRVINSGINLSRFKKNPVMLNRHKSSNEEVIGLWKNIRVEGDQLLADAEFDTEDELAKKIASKVEKGYLKGCSMGISISHDTGFEKEEKGNLILRKCELLEASIVAVPSNAGAIKLYHEGQLMSKADIQLSISNTIKQKIKNTKMERSILTKEAILALELAGDYTESDLNKGILKMKDQWDADKKALVELQAKVENEKKEAAIAKVATLTKEGKIPAGSEREFVEMALRTPNVFDKVIAALPAKQSLAAQLQNPSATTDIKTEEDFQKLTEEQQLAFKEKQPEAYNKLFS